jgi:simple sugar transport system permease protein/D-ribose pyranase
VPDLATCSKAWPETSSSRGELRRYAPDHNPVLLDTLRRLFPEADHSMIPHASILGEMASKAKAIVRTGAFDPWGNIFCARAWTCPAGSTSRAWWRRRSTPGSSGVD